MVRKLLFILVIIGLLAVGVSAAGAQAEASSASACAGAPAPRLVAGQNGRVTPGLPNVVRSVPGRGWNSVIVGQIPGGGVFNVVAGSGPQCADGMYWWYVNYNGLVGWTAEGQSYGPYWTEPVGSPAPYCLPSRLTPGGWGIVTPGLPNLLRSQPWRGSGSRVLGQIPAGGVFTVLPGYAPQCAADGLLWVYVNYNGINGWTPESNGSIYWTDPFYGGDGPACNSLPARLTVGGYARVLPGLPNSIRTDASIYSPRIGRIPAGSVFAVIGGPVCADSVTYYQVNYNGIIGWTGEGRFGEYWVEPW